MKPTNFIDSNCESRSANCVIWPGPDIDVICLKKGQSVSWAIYKLAKKIVELEAALSIDNMNTTALTAMEAEFGGPITTFNQVVQNLLTKAYPTT